MSRLVKKAPSQCTDLPLDNADISEKLRLFSQLVRSCFGPTGRLKQIHNNVGGNVTTTSVSSVLLAAISSSQPLINLIKTSICNHVSRHSDCGLFAAVFCLSLIERAKQSPVRRRVFLDVYKHMLALCTGYLQREDCGCKVRLDFNNSRNLITLARSVVSSKPACVLTEPEVLHISRLCVQAFLLTVPCHQPGTVTLGDVVTVSVEGPSVDESAVFSGLMLELPACSYPPKMYSPRPGPLRTVLLSASLAGDLCEVGDGDIEVARGVDTDSQVLDRLMELGQQVVKDEVGLFVCQKVIHPVLQQYLRSHGVLVVERVGIAQMEPLSQLTGAQPVAAVHTTIPTTTYGKVRDVSVRQFGSKKMLHLHSPVESSICTRILCHRNETMLSELKVVCQKTEQVLRLTLRDPSALLGGGCTETHLAAYVRNKSMGDLAEIVQALGCSQSECIRAVEGFCRSLESVAGALEHDGGSSSVDLTHGHHWSLPAGNMTEEPSVALSSCGCGLVKSSQSIRWTYLNTDSLQFSPEPLNVTSDLRPRVLDSFTAKLNALQVAVETANLALDVQYIVRDVN